jgi:type IV secretory pathway VirB10-like protein
MNTRWLRLLCAGALALTSLLAHAQYSWIDDKGTRVFADRPPPPGTPPERILKTPRGFEPRPPQPDAAAAAPASAPTAKAAPTLAERDEDFRKRAAQREADDKKAAQEATDKAAKTANCQIARENARTLEAGVRISTVDEKGERVILSDEERARRTARTRQTLKSCS